MGPHDTAREMRELIDAGRQEEVLERLPGLGEDQVAVSAEVFRYLMSTTGDPDGQIAAAVATLLDRAIAVAGQDWEQGLALMDALLAMCSGIPELANSAAAIGYNRAAVLRELHRNDEAEAAYEAIVTEFGMQPQQGFWVALALYNHAGLLLGIGDEAAAERMSPVVARLKAGFAESEDPRLQRRVRRAMANEASLLRKLGHQDEMEQAMGRLHDLMRPASDRVLAVLAEVDPELDLDEGTPIRATTRDRLVLAFMEGLDTTLDVVRQLADIDTSELLDRVCSHPDLLTTSGIVTLSAVRDGQIPGAEGDADRERIDRGLTMVGSVMHFLVGEPSQYRLGSGPIEGLLGSIDVSVSMEDALQLACSPRIVCSLSPVYVDALTRWTKQLLPGGHWREARRAHQLLLAAAERAPNSEEGRVVVHLARFGWLFVARQVLTHIPDGRVLRSATDAGERLMRMFERQGEHAQAAEVLLALGALYIDPYGSARSAGSDSYLPELRRWTDRLAEQVLDPVELAEGPAPVMPGPKEALAVGEEYLRKARELADPVQVSHILGLMLTSRIARMALGEEIDEGELADLAIRLGESVDAEHYPQLLAQSLVIVARGHRDLAEAGLERLLARPISEIAAQGGADAAVGVLLGAGAILLSGDKARGRRLFAESADFIRGLGEQERARLLKCHMLLLLDGTELGSEDPRAGLSAESAGGALFNRARQEGWSEERAALALIALAGRGHLKSADLEREREWLVILDIVPQLFPKFITGHADALTFLYAAWLTQAAVRASERGDPGHALRAQAAACDRYLSLELPDAAMESLTLIGTLVQDNRGTSLGRAAEALAPVVVRAENLIGQAATEALQTIWSHIIGTFSTKVDVASMIACFQMAKGARFVAAMRAGLPYDSRTDGQASELLAAIGQVDEPTDRDQGLDPFTLVSPYSERLDAVGRISAADVRENLEHRFDALVQRRLSASDSQPFRLLDTGEVLGQLPADTVLLWTHLARDPGGGRVMTALVGADNHLVAATFQPLMTAEMADQRYEVSLGGRVRTLDLVQLDVDRVRREVLAEPGPSRVVSREGAQRLDQTLNAFFGPATELLHEQYAAGRRHLVFVPTGPLHFLPLHLCHWDGKPLAEVWTVTYLPNLALLERPPILHGRRKPRLEAVGIGFENGPLEPIPEAVNEAQAIAAEFGVQALTNERATRDAVLDALGSAEFFHIATHGLHNVTAPAFQCLFAADGRLSAHELLRLNLGGLELVTLSACETALGRFDGADNLRGISANLLLRGTRAIVGTLWPVETWTSHAFFTALYRELGGGASRLDAFAAAQAQTRAAHPQYRDWGAFYYVGDWR
jgi:CHAT domain